MLPTPNMYMRDWADTPKSAQRQEDDLPTGIKNAIKICFPIWLLIGLGVLVRILWSKPF